MKVLSVRQPWAWAIARGWKQIENRSWNTSFRGLLAIHAPLTEDLADLPMVIHLVRMQTTPWGRAPAAPSVLQQAYRDTRGPLGCVVGVANLVGVVEGPEPNGGGTWFDDPWFGGPWGFVLRDARAVKPIRLRGRPGLFDADISPEAS